MEENNFIDIINYWIDVELSNPPYIKTNNTVKKSALRWNQVVSFLENKNDIIWSVPLKEKIDNNHEWIHRVYLGIYNTKYVIQEYSEDSEEVNELKNSHNTCLISFDLNNKGKVISNSVNVPEYLSSIAYSITKKQRVFEEKIKDLFATWNFTIEKRGTLINKEDLNELITMILFELDWKLLNTVYENKKFEYLAYTESLSLNANRTLHFDSNITRSLIADDLINVRNEIRDKGVESSLKSYITKKTIEKKDVVKNKEYLKEELKIEKLPDVCWPMPQGKKLVTSQQFSVNKIFSELENTGVFSINGPPGTGKTTILKDVIANIIYKRACNIVKFKNNINDAFSKIGDITYKFSGRGVKEIYGLHSSISGHEILVASSNNGAVQNITNELPLMTEINEKYHSKLKYFSETANGLNNSNSWGTISASLGNKNNNYNFISNFLYRNANEEKHTRSIFDYLASPQYFDEDFLSFEEACNDFLNCQKKLKDLKDHIFQINDLIKNEDKIISEKKELMTEYHRKINTLKKAKTEINKFEKRLISLKKLKDKEVFIYKKNKEKKLLKKNENRILEKIEEIQNDLEYNFSLYKKEKQKFIEDKNLLQEIKNKILNLDSKIRKINTYVKKYKKIISAELANDLFWKQEDNLIQNSSPLINNKLQEARENLFIASMNLHKAFIIESQDKIKNNLRTFREILEEGFNEREDFSQAIWETLFLIVPVISTTFSSLGKLLSTIKEDGIGWLLIDEAGQSTPQAPVGGLWRSRRAIIVGDPQQVEPVVNIEKKLSDVLLEKNNVSPIWNSFSFSAQQLADRNNQWGTIINMGSRKTWVGSPLRVHRRCDEPMFSISNKIAYSNNMILGKKERHDLTNIEEKIGKTCWFKTDGLPQDNSHWVKEEGLLLINKLALITKNTNKLPEIFIISPFKSVAFETILLIKKHRNDWLDNSISDIDLNAWINNSIGTIHAFQGKETSSVFLLLGGNISKPGAISWVCEEPNILNVATTRAKNSFYIIGNTQVWNKGVFGLIRNEINII